MIFSALSFCSSCFFVMMFSVLSFLCVTDITMEISVLVHGLCGLSNISADFRLSNNVS
jgi:hypothetical protein